VLKVMFLLKRKPGLSMAEFIERYETVHVPLAERNVSRLLKYERHYLHPGSHVILGDAVMEPDYDVITELWYDDVDTFERQQESLRAQPALVAEIIADEEQLFDRAKSRLVFAEDRVSEVSGGQVNDERDPALQRLLDKDAIIDLVHRYSYCVDHKLHDEIPELFTENCVVDYGPGLAPPLHGRAELRALFGDDHAPTRARPGFVATSHHNANVLVSFDGDDRAIVLTSLYAWHETTDGAHPRVWGYYHDVALRTSEGWRLAERVLRVAGNEDWPTEWHPLLEPGE
jgi:hypothetical protein